MRASPFYFIFACVHTVFSHTQPLRCAQFMYFFQRGSFVSNGERYFVEPANDRKVNSSAHFRKYHLVFRHSAAVGEGVSNAPSTCGVMGKLH